MKTFCSLPFTSVSIGARGEYRVCCNSHDPSVRDETGKEITISDQGLEYFNGVFMKSLRRDMMTGARPSLCRRCFDMEDRGMRSFRADHNAAHRAAAKIALQRINAEGAIADPMISYLNVDVGNKCNVRCRMCHPQSSSLLAKEALEYPINAPQGFSSYQRDDLQRLSEGTSWMEEAGGKRILSAVAPTTEIIYLIGGEPFLIEEQRRFLEEIVEQGRASEVTLQYNTNLTVLPKKLLEVWSHFKLVKIAASIDGIGNVYEYIRNPVRWEKIKSNLQALLVLMESRQNNIKLEVHSTVQALNVLGLADLILFLLELPENAPKDDIRSIDPVPFFINVDHPRFLSPDVLPVEVIRKGISQLHAVAARYPEVTQSCRFLDLITRLEFATNNRDTASWKTFLDAMSIQDKLRNESLFSVIEELKAFI